MPHILMFFFQNALLFNCAFYTDSQGGSTDQSINQSKNNHLQK